MISIIIPVYNVEEYLGDCIESIIAQTFQDWELILVDDGSPDQSGALCDKYVFSDPRIRVFHKTNGGVSSARNLGIQKAEGEWITFIDADDFVGKFYLHGLYRPIEEGECVDFVHGGCTNYENGAATTINQSYKYYVGNDKGKVFSLFRGLVVSKLFKTELIKRIHLTFDEGMSVAEDMAFTLDYLLFVNYYAFVPEINYFYRRDNVGSTTHKTIQLSYEEEKHGFEHLYNSTIAYIKKYDVSKEDSQIRYEQRSRQYFQMLRSMYYNKSLNQYKRLKILKEESTSEHFFLLYYIPKELNYYPFVQLLLNKKFIFFDIIQNAYECFVKVKVCIESFLCFK